MDFNDTPQEAAFRADVRRWLEDSAVEYRQPLPHGISTHEYAERGRDWQKRKAAAGYAAIRWSRADGGLDGTPMQEVIFAEEEGRYHVPVGPFVGIGVHLAVPTIRSHGSAAQIEQFARPTLLGDMLWCQLFSEPAAGSDLAALRTRAVRDGDDWVINGQKVWTSWAHTADWGILLARTDPDQPKHRGLTYFLVDMRSAGIEVRPIRQLSGQSEFNEVFLTDVRIPDNQRLGAVGDGWKVAMTTLMNERSSIGGESRSLPDVTELLQLAAEKPAAAAPYRQQLARLYAREQGLKYFRCRQLTALSRGETPSPIGAMSKLVYANLLQDLCATALDLGGPEALLRQQDERIDKFRRGYLWGAALRIAGGTDEILRNQIAERVLGLPGEIRTDKDVPFAKLPAGK